MAGVGLTGDFGDDALSPSVFVEVGFSVSFLLSDFVSNFDPDLDTALSFALAS